MRPTVEDFRALSRSSPWRWRTLHFTRHTDTGEVEAWVRRPGDLLVRPAGRPEEYVHGVPYSSSSFTLTSSPAETNVEPTTEVFSRPDAAPMFRSDGLVAERPEHWYFEHSDPMWENYTWTAMLDPDELGHHVAVDAVRAEARDERETWVARLRPGEGYEPRCGCCPLLWSEVSVHAEYGDEPERLARFAAEGYPDAHEVALDVGTGVVVDLRPIGGGRTDLGFSVEIHEVDTDLDAVFEGQASASRIE
jgi:hypothetical protein